MGLLLEVGWIEHSAIIFLRDEDATKQSYRPHNVEMLRGLYLHDDCCVRCRMEKAVKDAAFRIRCIMSDQMHVKPEEKRLLKFSQLIREDVLGVLSEDENKK
jgi:hypothetical protein